jgi:hypothetical protein
MLKHSFLSARIVQAAGAKLDEAYSIHITDRPSDDRGKSHNSAAQSDELTNAIGRSEN